MSKNQKKKDNKLIKQTVEQYFSAHPNQLFNYKQLSRILGITDAKGKEYLEKLLFSLAENDFLKEERRGKFRLNFKGSYITGRTDFTSRGSAYIISDETSDDVFISQKHVKNALHGDLVKVKLLPSSRDKQKGEIVEVIERRKVHFSGIIQKSKNFAFFIPDDNKVHVDFYISKNDLGEAQDGEKVIAEIKDWPEGADNPFAKVTKVLGQPGEHFAEIHAIISEFDLPEEFPIGVMKEAEATPEIIPESEIKKRRDFRKIPTITIDPIDAKDFDDALSFEDLGEGLYRIGVHIADVSHYVRPGTKLDEEAFNRATSVYLVDRVIPMLPEKLSNNVCSLRPEEDRLAFSAVFDIDKNAKIKSTWVGRTIIRSDKRFAYEEAQEIIEKGKGIFDTEILTINSIARILRQKRFANGAINFEQTEVKFKLDEKGKPIEVFFKESKEAHQLIEEFMLLANKHVATLIGKPEQGKSPKPFVYRIHDSPDPEKLRDFSVFAKKMGYNVKLEGNKHISESLNGLLADVKGKGEQHMMEQLAIRTMAKAIYSTNNIGHYGLGFSFYSHFTSPIRRYPDLMVHRLLAHYLSGETKPLIDNLEKRCKHCSEMEKVASDAERASIKFKQVEYMSERIGKVFAGIITGVTEWGIYVEMIENKCEGMIRLKDMKDDYYFFDEKNYRAVGKKHGEVYQIGQGVNVKIIKADLMKKQIELQIIE